MKQVTLLQPPVEESHEWRLDSVDLKIVTTKKKKKKKSQPRSYVSFGGNF